MKKFLATLLISTSLLPIVAKADIPVDSIDEQWGKPTLVYGGGLYDADIKVVNAYYNLDDSNISNVNRLVADGNDMDKYLGTNGASTKSMFSSVMVKKQSERKGVTVTIKTPKDITAISEDQYANAAITAGAKGLDVVVVSPYKVSGESALTGVYKALKENGEDVDIERTELAQREIETVGQISNSMNMNGQETAQLSSALSQIKVELAKANQKEKPNEQEVRDIVVQAVEDNKLDQLIMIDDINLLVAYAKAYQETDAVNDTEVNKALQNLQNNMAQKYKNIKSSITSSEAQGFFESVGNWLRDVWNNIVGIFK